MQSLKISKGTLKNMRVLAKVIYIISRICWIILMVGAVLLALGGFIFMVVFNSIGTYYNDGAETEFWEAFDTGLTLGLKNDLKDADEETLEAAREYAYDLILGENSESFIMFVTTVIVGGIAEAIVLIFIFMKLDKLFKNIATGATPFNKENPKIIRMIGWGILVCLLVEWIFGRLASYALSVSTAFTSNINLISIIGILIVFALSYVFNYAYELQKNYISVAKEIEQ